MSELSELNRSEQEPQLPPVDPESAEFLAHAQKGAEDRESHVGTVRLSESGSHADLSDFEKANQVYQESPEAATHMNAGIPLPLKAKNDSHAVELANKLIDTGSGDGDTLTQFLEQEIPGE
jgi:hypothetical protein